MECVLAGEDVRAGQSHERQARTVGAAADAGSHRCEPGTLNCLHGVGGDFRMAVQHLFHVAVLLFDFQSIGRSWKISHDLLHDRLEQVFLLLEAGFGEVAHDQAQLRAVQPAFEPGDVQEALAVLGGLRRAGVLRQPLDDARGDLDRVLHPALGEAGMGADALDGDDSSIRREGLVLQVAGALAVDGVGEIRRELFQVDLVDAAADFLVRREQDLDGAVLDLRMLDQETRRIHDLGDAGLVVGAQQRGAVGGDDVVADLVAQRRVLVDADDLGRVRRQHDVAALIVRHDLRLDVLAGAVGGRIHVRAEADHGDRLRRGRWDRAVDITVLVELGVVNAHVPELLGQQAAQVFLLVGGGAGRRVRVGLGVDGDVAQEALGHRVGKGEGKGHCESRRSDHREIIPGQSLRFAPERS